MLRKWIKKYKRSYMLQSLRGYSHLKNNDELKRLTKIRAALALTPFQHMVSKKSSLIFGGAAAQVDLITRQYLHIRFVLNHFPPAFYRTARNSNKSKLVFPLPRQWQTIIEKEGVEVSRVKCSLLWSLYMLLFWCYGIYTITSIIFQSVREIFAQHYKDMGEMLHFEQLSANNFPKQLNQGQTQDFISWYFKHYETSQNIKTITHRANGQLPADYQGINLQRLKIPLLPLSSAGVLVNYILWSIGAVALSFAHLLIGKWESALLLSEAALGKQAALLPKQKLARKYLFNNSGQVYRPLWTYIAEQRNAEIILYFYSTNYEGFKRPDGYTGESHTRKLMSWPKYLLWEESQIPYLKQQLGEHLNYEIVGPIWFSDSDKELPAFKQNAIAIFDVQPVRLTKYYTLAVDFDYYVPEVASKFIEEIAQVANQSNHTLYWKRKRNIGKMVHPVFFSRTQKVMDQNDIIAIEPEISANRVIEQSDMVISMPFTSTALIAKHMGKPSCYYDASGLLQPDDKGAHNIPIIQDQKSLTEWIQMNSIKTN